MNTRRLGANGTRRFGLGALDVTLSAEDLAQIGEVVGSAAGLRYPEEMMKSLNI